MLDIQKAARLIKEDGLYTFIYNEMKELSGKEGLTVEEILHLLNENPKFLDDYKTLNSQSEISNIQIREQIINKDDSEECKSIKKKINENRRKLLSLEAYGNEPDSMLYAVWIGSAVIFTIFVIHNLVVLYTYWYENHPFYVYLFYLFSVISGFLFYRKKIRDHHRLHKKFREIEKETKTLIEKGKEKGCIDKIYTD
ncbi:MAG TPA: hypothetical protein DEP48_08070 [Persephonella sp.]|uniref:2TM domain-containing protein n=1 Tax=Persephonella marina (strain DSM 14350 / EX-H1) TaxID=123214 RepID=C0QTR8_PERMH|nr:MULTISPECIES: hypothetical protein [Persephonella]ACO04396.1 conserved hypothetical protein [Persephonella marina EX-H1]HCB70300.1 hypothetical protein [Persephonella sp.]